MAKSMKPKLMKVVIAGVVALGVVVMMQLWGAAFDDGVFWKLVISCLIVITIAGVLIAVFSDMQDDEKHKKDKYLS